MIAKRRQAARVLTLLCAISALAFGQSNSREPMKLHKLTPSLYMVEGAGGNVVVLTTSEGVVLVDDKNVGDENTNELLALIKTVSDQPVKYVFITHYHADHIGGNERLRKLGAQIISQVTTRDNITGPVWKTTKVYDTEGKFVREQAYNPTSAAGKWSPVAPDLVFTDEMKLVIGGKEVRARYFGPAHTGGDAFVFFPSERALAVGDNMRPFCSICVDYHAGGSLVNYIKVLDGVLGAPGTGVKSLDAFDIVIPGHGDVSNRAGLQEHRNKLVQMRDLVTKLKHEGKSYGEIARVMMTEYKWEPEDRNLGQWTFPGMMKELE
jgi:glyoxylase-like metal-dependent hydrolase (beta-lactamase superfamily II)